MPLSMHKYEAPISIHASKTHPAEREDSRGQSTSPAHPPLYLLVLSRACIGPTVLISAASKSRSRKSWPRLDLHCPRTRQAPASPAPATHPDLAAPLRPAAGTSQSLRLAQGWAPKDVGAFAVGDGVGAVVAGVLTPRAERKRGWRQEQVPVWTRTTVRIPEYVLDPRSSWAARSVGLNSRFRRAARGV